MKHFDYAGVLTIEFFVQRGRLVANEMAPRVHNSGHWTIEGAVTSQFENHLRAILGLPLGETDGDRPLGDDQFHRRAAGARRTARRARRCTGTTTARSRAPGRKIGHCTVVAGSAVERDRLVRKVMKRLPRLGSG